MTKKNVFFLKDGTILMIDVCEMINVTNCSLFRIYIVYK